VPLAGCGGAASFADNPAKAADYLGVEGTLYRFAPAEAPDDTPLCLLAWEGAWHTWTGEVALDAATDAVELPYIVAGALMVDGVELLRAEPGSGSEYTAYYGVFPDTVTQDVDDIAFAGEWVFARGFGPVHTSFAGVARDLVYYEYDAGPEGDSGGGGPGDSGGDSGTGAL
jgi:hypothetical protein